MKNKKKTSAKMQQQPDPLASAQWVSESSQQSTGHAPPQNSNSPGSGITLDEDLFELPNIGAEDFAGYPVGYTNDSGEEVEDVELTFPSGPSPGPFKIDSITSDQIVFKSTEAAGPGGIGMVSAKLKFIGKEGRDLGSVNFKAGVKQTLIHLGLKAKDAAQFALSLSEDVGITFEETGAALNFGTVATTEMKATALARLTAGPIEASFQANGKTAISGMGAANRSVTSSASAAFKFSILETTVGTLSAQGSQSWAWQPGTNSSSTSTSVGVRFDSASVELRRIRLKISFGIDISSKTTTSPTKSVTLGGTTWTIQGEATW